MTECFHGSIQPKNAIVDISDNFEMQIFNLQAPPKFQLQTNESPIKVVRPNENQHRFHYQRFFYTIAVLTLNCQIGLLATNIVHSKHWDTPGNKALAVTEAVLLTAFGLHMHCFNKHRLELAYFVNMIQIFGTRMNGHWDSRWKRSFRQKLNILVSELGILTGIAFPIGFVFALHWSNPNKASLVGYWILDEETIDKMDNIQLFLKSCLHVGVYLVNLVVWFYGALAGVFAVGVMHTLSIVLFIDFMNTFQFSKKINNGSDYQRGLLFRQIQLIACVFNNIHRGWMMTIILVAPIAVLPFGMLYLIRSSWTLDTLAQQALFVLVVVNCILTLFSLIGTMACVHSKSEDVVREMKWGSAQDHKQKWSSSFWRSCGRYIRIQFGQNHFVDRFTPLHGFDIAMSLTAELLLLT